MGSAEKDNMKVELEVVDTQAANETGDGKTSADLELELVEIDENDEENYEVEDGFEDPLISCVSRFLHSVNDVEEAIRVLVPIAIENDEKQQEDLVNSFKEAEKYAKDANPANQALASSLFLKNSRRASRYVNAKVPNTLIKSLFLNVFSDFDTYTGELLLAIYAKKPELFQSITKSVPLSEIVKCDDIEKLKDKILLEEIETFRRKSYVEQFETLEKQFGLKTLREFKNWPVFVEATQRRNLFMHCDAIVSEQYIKICKENSFSVNDVCIGDKLVLRKDYFSNILNVMRETSIKLAHVLWRKVLPDEIEASDEALHLTIYDCLNDENWELAILIGDFVRNHARSKSDLMQRINLINLAIAQKSAGNMAVADKILHSVDWSASIADFRLAVAVLEDDFKLASEFMLKVGKNGDLIEERSYLEWPLFRQFRESKEFMDTYHTVFGYSFITKMQENAHEYEKELDEKDVGLLNETESHYGCLDSSSVELESSPQSLKEILL